MRTWILIGLLTILAVGIVTAFAVLAHDERKVQHPLTNETDDAAYSIVHLANDITSLVIKGENGNSVYKPEKGIIRLPAGKYWVESWNITKKDDTSARWEMQAKLPPGELSTFAITHNEETSLPFGEPVYCKIKSDRNSSGYSFEQMLEGRHGEQIVLTRNRARPPAPRLRAKSKDGTYDQSISFAYG